MKNFILFLLIVGLFVSCNNNNSDINPLAPAEEITNDFGKGPNFVFLPKKNTISFEKVTSKQVTITPKKRKTITLKQKYRSGNDLIKVKMKLIFRKGTVDKKIKVHAEMDTDIAGGKIDLNFGPSPITFNKPVLLNFEIKGLTGDALKRFQEITRFVHISPNGDLEDLSYKYLGVKLYDTGNDDDEGESVQKGKFILRKGVIPHFTRFGFFR